MSDFDSMVDDNAPPAPVTGQPALAPAPQQAGGVSFDDMQDDEEKYGTAGQMAKTFVEGASQGVLGPAAPYLEKTLGIADEKDILSRQETNPITHGVGEVAGLAGTSMAGVGAGALLGKAGEAAKALAFGEKAAEGASLGFKVGASAVAQAAEMGVMQGSDEVSKMILNDPNTSAESAIANIGMAAALGGAGGAFMTGAVNPLWEATVGPKVEGFLQGLKNHIDGTPFAMAGDLKAAEQSLGIEIAPELKAAMSGNHTAAESFNILKESGNKGLAESLEKFHNDLGESVANGLGIAPEDVAVHSEHEAGNSILDSFKKEYKEKYGPIAEAMDNRNMEAAKIAIDDESRLAKYGQMLEDGMQKWGTDSPMYKEYNTWGNRLLAKDTVGGLDMIKTELNGEISKAVRAGDSNTMMALKDIRSSLSDFQEAQLAKIPGKEGMIAERAATNASYKEFAKMSGDLTDHLGVGNFKGAGTLMSKLGNDVSPEQLLKKFSFKGNADFIPFLKQNFPEVYNKVREQELKNFLKPAVLAAKGDAPINIGKLNSLIENGMAGQPEYIKSILPQEALDKIAAANKLAEALPIKPSSGAAGHMAGLFKDMPRSALAGVSMIMGHNPIIGGIIGHMSQLMGRDLPDAMRLAHLKYLASDQPIKAAGFKSMVEFFHNTYKGENLLSKATANVFKRGAQVLTDNMMPNKADREKLDKTVTQLQENPEKLMKMQQGNVGHYLPNHQIGISATQANAVQYLQHLKPKDHILGPLDKPVPPQPVEIARYNRALDIAQQPAIVLHHIKEGTLQTSDIADLHTMYPGIYKNMTAKLSDAMTSHHSNEEPIPYRTRVGIGLFLGAPIDKSMEPMSIVAAQMGSKSAGQAQQGQQKPPPASKTNKLGKSVSEYRTPGQAAEKDRSSRD